MKRFHAFCEKFNVLTPFPLSEQLLCCFASHLATQGLAPQTGKAYNCWRQVGEVQSARESSSRSRSGRDGGGGGGGGGGFLAVC